MKVVGHGRDRESAEEDARKKAAAKGRVILAYGDSGYINEDVFEVEVTTVKPGWFMRDVKRAAARSKMWSSAPPRK